MSDNESNSSSDAELDDDLDTIMATPATPNIAQQLRNDLQALAARVTASEGKLTTTKAQLTTTQGQLATAQAELATTKAELAKVKTTSGSTNPTKTKVKLEQPDKYGGDRDLLPG